MKRILIFLLTAVSMQIYGQPGKPLSYTVTATSPNRYVEEPRQLLQQSDGKIIVALRLTTYTPRTALARFTAKGELDNTFGDGGLSAFIDVIPTDVALQPDGSIIVVGTPYNGDPFIPGPVSIVVARFRPNGQFDRSFGTNGFYRRTGGVDPAPTAVAVQPDGKIIIAARSGQGAQPSPTVFRLTSEGSPDPTFSLNRRPATLPTLPYPTFPAATIAALTVQPDGKILVAGRLSYLESSFIERFNANGEADLTFAQNGLLYDSSSRLGSLSRIAVQPDGRFIVGGFDKNLILSRYTSGGTLDPGFGNGGRVMITVNQDYILSSLKTLPSGKIIAGNSSTLVLFNADGSLNTGFGAGGLLQSTAYSAINGLVIQPDEKIVVAGKNGSDIALVRYDLNGTPDPTFSNDGKLQFFYSVSNPSPTLIQQEGLGSVVVSTKSRNPITEYLFNDDPTNWNTFSITKYAKGSTIDPSFGTDGTATAPLGTARAFIKQADGKFLIAGGDKNVTLARFDRDGKPDNAFGTNGQISADFGNTREYATAITQQADGKITVMVKVEQDGIISFMLLRYNNDGSPDNSLNGTGMLVTPFGGEVKIQPDGKMLIGGTLTLSPSNKDFAIARYLPNGQPDLSFSSDGIQTADFASGIDSIVSLQVQEDGRIFAAGSAVVAGKSTFAIARFNANGTPDLSFSLDGKTTIQFGTEDDFLLAMELQQDGKIIAGGETRVNNSGHIAIARLLRNGDLDLAFDGDGKIINRPNPDDPDNSRFVTSLSIAYSRFFAGISGRHGQVESAEYDAEFIPAIPKLALNYRYYEGNWTTLPDFNALQAVDYGTIQNADISKRPPATADHFGFVWEGKIYLPSPGTYTFELRSDDGSKFYFNQPYSFNATALVNNDGVHSVQSATGSVTVDTAGGYPFALAYFEGILDETLELYWSGPGFTRQLVPPSAFVKQDRDRPTAPENLLIVKLASTFINLNWGKATDNVGVDSYAVTVTSGAERFRLISTTNNNITIDSLKPDTQYFISVNARDAAGNYSSGSAFLNFRTPKVSPGLAYRYYEGDWDNLPDFNSINHIKSGTVENVDLLMRNRDDYFGVVWEGQINIPVTGDYTFEIISDDGSKLFFDKVYKANETALIDNDGLHDASKSASLQNVTAGLHNIALAYFEKWGAEKMQIYWTGPGIPRQLVPSSAFGNVGAPVANLDYKYYEGDWDALPDFSSLTPVKVGKSASPDLAERRAGVEDHFGFVWNGYINLPVAGAYTFETISDDGSKFYFNHHYVHSLTAQVNNDGLHGEQSVSATVTILQPGIYPISMAYFEKWGGEAMKVYYSGPNIPRQLIPASAFVARPADTVIPSPPKFVNIGNIVDNRLELYWNGATDDQGIAGYGVYINNVLKYVVNTTNFTTPDLQPGLTYGFNFTAIDRAGNESELSPSVIHQHKVGEVYAGLKYNYYEGDWNTIPDYTTLTPLKKGIVPTPDFSMRNVDDYFSVFYEGKIYIPQPDDYTFELSSDDGSRFYFNGTQLIDNDGLHDYVNTPKATVHIDAAGYYPIAISYFEKWGNESLTLYWSSSIYSRRPVEPQFFSHDPDPVAAAFGNSSSMTQQAEVVKTGSFSVYPNPFKDHVRIDFENKTAGSTIGIDVFDLTGKRVFTQQYSNQSAGKVSNSLRLPGLPNGVYNVRVNTNGVPFKMVKIVK